MLDNNAVLISTPQPLRAEHFVACMPPILGTFTFLRDGRNAVACPERQRAEQMRVISFRKASPEWTWDDMSKAPPYLT